MLALHFSHCGFALNIVAKDLLRVVVPFRAKRIVQGSLLSVRDHRVGFAYLLESLVGSRFPVPIGMVFEG